ncbi:recombinase family protein [Rhizobium leguminosarum]
MVLIGYARVSTVGQSLEVQTSKLTAAGVESDHLYTDKKTGVDRDRPGLKDALRFARKGDTFVVCKIDRLARSTIDLMNIVNELENKGVQFKVLDQSIDTTTKEGRMMLGFLAVIAQFETEIRHERQMDGIAQAKQDGVKFGRKIVMTDKVVELIRTMKAEGKSIAEIMKASGMSRPSVYRALASAEVDCEAPSQT